MTSITLILRKYNVHGRKHTGHTDHWDKWLANMNNEFFNSCSVGFQKILEIIDLLSLQDSVN